MVSELLADSKGHHRAGEIAKADIRTAPRQTSDSDDVSNETKNNTPPGRKLEENIALLWARESKNGRNFRNLHPSKRRRRSQDLEAFFYEVNISAQRTDASKAAREMGSLAHYASLGLVRKPLPRKHHEERTRLISLSLMDFDDGNEHHTRLLDEVCRLYTGKDAGSDPGGRDHWKELGLGTAAETGMWKSSGLLTLWMMLHLYQRNKNLALSIFKDSKREEGGFLFAESCDRATGWVLNAIKRGKLNAIVADMDPLKTTKDENPRQTYIEAAKRLFVGFMYKFHYYMKEAQDAASARQKTAFYLKRDLSVLLKIAEVPDILYLNEELFLKDTLAKRIRRLFKHSFACMTVDRFREYEEVHRR